MTNKKAIRLDFTKIYNNNEFKGTESLSGPGSSIARTTALRTTMRHIIDKYSIKSMLDIPCGDCNWISHTNLSGLDCYIGADIVPALIAKNIEKNLHLGSFKVLDLRTDKLPLSDLIFCRDCLCHMPLEDITLSLLNIKKSGSKWLLTTTFPRCEYNIELESIWRPLNLILPPFNLTATEIFLEDPAVNMSSLYSDKSIALIDIDKIQI